jgi:hypothetical protein
MSDAIWLIKVPGHPLEEGKIGVGRQNIATGWMQRLWNKSRTQP